MRCLLPVLLASLTMIGCGRERTDYHLDHNTFDAKTLAMVQQRTRITMPEGSRGLNFYWAGAKCVDPWFLAKIEIPATAAETMMTQIESRQDGDFGVSLNPSGSVTWWTPSETNRVDRRFTIPELGYVHAIYCKEDGRWVLYLEWTRMH